MTDKQIYQMAEAFYQDSLAKFSPNLKACPDVYKIMFRSGFEMGQYLMSVEQVQRAFKEFDRKYKRRYELDHIAACAGVKTKVKDK